MEYRIIDRAHRADVNIKNEPFRIYGRMIPTLSGGTWEVTSVLFPEQEIREICYPDENYDFDAMEGDHLFIGAYDGDRCVGLAVMADDMFRYMYLDDLKVCAAYRGRGVGRGLIGAALRAAKERNYRGIWAIGQDDNLAACRFYLKLGFEIGGFDNRIYRGTTQENSANISFYLE